MSDPITDALTRAADAIERLKTEQARDAVAIEKRLATLETIPREIGQLRREIHELTEKVVLRETVEQMIALAMAEHERDLAIKDRSKPQPGASTIMRIEDRKAEREDKKSRLEFWGKIIAAAIAAAVAYSSLNANIKIEQIRTEQKQKKGE